MREYRLEREYGARGYVGGPLVVSWSEPGDPDSFNPTEPERCGIAPPSENLIETATCQWGAGQPSESPRMKAFLDSERPDFAAIIRDIARGG